MTQSKLNLAIIGWDYEDMNTKLFRSQHEIIETLRHDSGGAL